MTTDHLVSHDILCSGSRDVSRQVGIDWRTFAISRCEPIKNLTHLLIGCQHFLHTPSNVFDIFIVTIIITLLQFDIKYGLYLTTTEEWTPHSSCYRACFMFWRCQVHISSRRSMISWPKFFEVPHIRPRPFYSTAFQIYNFLIVVASLNRSRM